ncbi:MAG: PadR family transcriptional regulator [Gemmatimonadota bacterium]|jgi:DNA-binding PadR family transcriptional regulator
MERHWQGLKSVKAFRYHILLALAGDALHGAEIRRRVQDESQGEVTLYPAMLYGALDDLAGAGLITEVEPRDPAPDRVRWRFYGLTARGRETLEAETARLEAIVGRAREALGSTAGS